MENEREPNPEVTESTVKSNDDCESNMFLSDKSVGDCCWVMLYSDCTLIVAFSFLRFLGVFSGPTQIQKQYLSLSLFFFVTLSFFFCLVSFFSVLCQHRPTHTLLLHSCALIFACCLTNALSLAQD